MSKVSVIINCYRDSATLARAVDSALAQTRKPDEIIVVNDCSPETKQIEQVIGKYPEVIYVRNQEDLGLAGSRNAGITTARNEIVTFLDADDEMHPQKIEFQLRYLTPDVVVSCNLDRIKPGNLANLQRRFRQPHVEVITRMGLMPYRNRLTGASLMAYKSLLDRLGDYNSRLRACVDFDLWLRLIECRISILNVRLPLYIYYFNEKSLSKNFVLVSYEELEVLKNHFSRTGQVISKSSKASFLWALYLIKHLARYELTGNEELRAATIKNMKLLADRRWLVWLLLKMDQFHVLKLYRYLA